MINIYFSHDQDTLAYEAHVLSEQFDQRNIKHLIFKNNYQNIIDEISQIDLFIQPIFIIKNADFLIQKDKFDLMLTEYIKQFVGVIHLFVSTKNITDFNSIVIASTNVFKIKKCTKFSLSAKHALINKILRISHCDFLNPLIMENYESLLPNDPFIIINETNKLVLATNSKLIDQALVDNITCIATEENIFKLVNYWLFNKKIELIRLYDSLIRIKYQPAELITILASQIFTMRLIKMALSNNLSSTDMEIKMGISKFMILNNRNIIHSTPLIKFDNMLNDLYKLDYNIKRSLISPHHALKIQLLK